MFYMHNKYICNFSTSQRYSNSHKWFAS